MNMHTCDIKRSDSLWRCVKGAFSLTWHAEVKSCSLFSTWLPHFYSLSSQKMEGLMDWLISSLTFDLSEHHFCCKPTVSSYQLLDAMWTQQASSSGIKRPHLYADQPIRDDQTTPLGQTTPPEPRLWLFKLVWETFLEFQSINFLSLFDALICEVWPEADQRQSVSHKCY